MTAIQALQAICDLDVTELQRSFRPASSAEIDPRDVRSARELAFQEPRLTDQRRLHLTEPRSPRLRNPDQLRRGDRYRPRPLQGGQNFG
jgi:hypothetical protein